MALYMDYWDSIDIGRPELNHSQGFFREFKVKIKNLINFIENCHLNRTNT